MAFLVLGGNFNGTRNLSPKLLEELVRRIILRCTNSGRVNSFVGHVKLTDLNRKKHLVLIGLGLLSIFCVITVFGQDRRKAHWLSSW